MGCEQMSFLKNRPVLCLLLIFSVVFLAVFSVIALTQSPYSTPSSEALVVDGGMEIKLGPFPNATSVALDSAITVDAVASATIGDLHITPETLIASSSSETTGPLTYLYKFYPAELLKPGTTYTVSTTLFDRQVSWSFKTTTEPFQPTLTYSLAKNAIWIAMASAASATAIAAIIIRRKHAKNSA